MTSRFEHRLARIERRQRLAPDPTPDPRGFVLATVFGFYCCDRAEDEHPLQACTATAMASSGDANAALQRLLEDFFAAHGANLDCEPTQDGVEAMQRLLDGVPERWRDAEVAWWPISATEMWTAPETPPVLS
jgi:hypothetical protein